jgi:transcriptional regulator with PAS, ATPase and Fis domain
VWISFGKSLEGKRKAASHLGISLATLYNKIRQYDI